MDKPSVKLADDPPIGKPTEEQVQRAVGLISSLLQVCGMVNRQELPPDYARKNTPLCMNQFKYQFGTTRIAANPADYLVNQYPATAKHIILLYRKQIIKVDVLHEPDMPVRVIEIAR